MTTMLMDMSSTLGVRPLGEAFLAPGGQREAQRRRLCGLGRLAAVDDVVLQELVEHLDAPALLRLAEASHWGYAWGSSPGLWRRLTLLLASSPEPEAPNGSNSSSSSSNNNRNRLLHPALPVAGLSGADGWKVCYRLLLRVKKEERHDGGGDIENYEENNHRSSGDEGEGRRTSSAVRARGVFSDLLFHSHLCSGASMARFPAHWLRRDNAPRRDAATLSVEAFVRDFEEPNLPETDGRATVPQAAPPPRAGTARG